MAVIPTTHLYDLAEVTKAIYAATIKADPPRIAPSQLQPVMAYLEQVTKKATEHHARLKADLTHATLWEKGRQLVVLQGIHSELFEWTLKLVQYSNAVNACMAIGKQNDPECTLWGVVAPLFFGIYDGPLGVSSPSAPDLRMPFMIANQLNELQRFEDTTADDAWRYLGEETKRVVITIEETTVGTLRLMSEAAGSALKATTGGLLSGLGELGPFLILGGGAVAIWYVWNGSRKVGA